MNIAIITDYYIEIDRKGLSFFNSDYPADVETWLKYDLVILLSPFTERALLSWTGHPHLRCCDTLEDLHSEIDMLENNVESERKYLIKYPDIDSLKIYNAYKSDIEQIYLESDLGTRRIRKRTFGDKTYFYETIKIRMTNCTAHEFEHKISEDDYNELKKRADKSKRPIIKSRYCFLYEGQYFELDVYDFWKDKAIVEIELTSENKEVNLPPEFELIKDVSEDFNYKNSQLARIDYEDS